MGELFGAAIGTVFIGGVFGWIVNKITAQPFAISDAIGLLLVVLIAGLTNPSANQSWLVYSVVSVPAYFLLQRMRAQHVANIPVTAAVERKIEPSEYATPTSELAAGITLEDEIFEAVRAQYHSTDRASGVVLSSAPIKNRSRNFITSHWRGELSLPVSYWLVNFLAYVAGATIVATLNAVFVPSKGYEPTLLLAANAAIWFALASILVWQVVGLWRSARRRATELGRLRRNAFWPLAAQLAVVIGVLQFMATFGTAGVPSLHELARIVFQNDPDIPDAKLMLTDGGKTLSIVGGIKYGLTRNVVTVLDAAPTVTALQLESLGGRVAEATKLFDVVRTRHLDTFVSTECSSACTLIFAAGANRFVGSSGYLGFHSGYYPGASAADIADINSNWASSYASVGISRQFLLKAMSTPSSEMWYPTAEELADADVTLGDISAARHVPDGFTLLGSLESVRQQLRAAGTLYQIIDDHAPATAEKIYEAAIKFERGEIAASDFRLTISQLVASEVRSRLPTSKDAVLIEYASVAAQQYGHLWQVNPEACYRYAVGDPSLNVSEYFSPELVQRENALSEKVIASESQLSGSTSVNLDEAWTAVRSMMMQTLSQQQMEMLGRETDAIRPEDYSSYCLSTQAMMNAIANLPSVQSAAVMRSFFQ